MSELCDLQIHINGQHTFFLSEKILSKYSWKLRKIIKQEKRRTQIRRSGIEIDDFPGGPDGFELISRFCYNNGTISITVENVSLLHCCSVFLGMSEKASPVNLLHQTEEFLDGVFYWSWNEIVTCLKNCDPFFSCAESCGLIQKLLCSLLVKIAQNSDVSLLSFSSSSSSSSPETARSLNSPVICNGSTSRKAWAWWFQDLTVLSPKIIEHFLRALGSFGSHNNNLVLTRFLLHYLKTALHSNDGSIRYASTEYRGLADTAVHGVVLMGKTAFSCRGLFWVLRIVSGFGLSREGRAALERLIGGMLDQATLDDLLVSGRNGGVYDVNLVVRLIRLFVHYYDKVSLEKMKKVGELIDMYLGEIGPDPNLKISKFLGVAESLPDCARDSFDQVYRAIDIYLQSHPCLSLEERSRLCRCLNYEKLSLEACKDLAKNPRIPPRIAVQALASQHSVIQAAEFVSEDHSSLSSNSYKCINTSSNNNNYQMVLYENNDNSSNLEMESSTDDKEDVKVNLERMQWRVVELEKVCRDMKGQMARMVKLTPQHTRPLPRLC
ncbi:UNVERIFIED_CONTAM: BTB/POZ domain-containing protein [Sesamum radiatum]|uniref:BTB/POZ domain-containing protein n=1 Tax=Sesamum radiatum TaxID=300843 RepID=A0AAW2N2A8_SESRA